jgi:predicted HicB family RNase H-like nuclease
LSSTERKRRRGDKSQRLVTHAMDEGKTLNAFIKDALEKAVSETHA